MKKLALLVAIVVVACGEAPLPSGDIFTQSVTPATAGADINEFVEFIVSHETALGSVTDYDITVTSDADEVVGVPLEASISLDSQTMNSETSVTGNDDMKTSRTSFKVDEGTATLEHTFRFLCKSDGIAKIEFETIAESFEGDGKQETEKNTVRIGCGTEKDIAGGGGNNTNFGDPEIENPCNAFEPEEIAAMVGHDVVETVQIDTDNRATCEYTRADGVESGARVILESGINSDAAGLREEWERQRMGATTTLDMEWSLDGEYRFADGAGSVWAYVRDDDPIGRDVYIWVTIVPSGDPGAPEATLQTAAIESAQELHSFLLSVQPVVDE